MQPRVPVTSVVLATVINLLGNIVLWVAAMAYRFGNAPWAPEDELTLVKVIGLCRGAGYVLLLLNAAVLLFALYRAARARNWWWVVLLIVLHAVLAYEALSIHTLYIFTVFEIKQDGSFL